MIRTKICGIQSTKDINYCVEAGADALGFVTEYPEEVPWNLSRKETQKLIKKTPPFVTSVLVTTGETKNEVLDLMDSTNADILQLHGEENMEMVREVTEDIHLIGKKIIKSAYLTNESRIFDFEEYGVDAILVDSKTDERPGGTGEEVDWEAAAEIFEELSVPGILAGGLNPSNINRAISTASPYAVDVLTGVEDKGHRKDPEKIKELLENVRLHQK